MIFSTLLATAVFAFNLYALFVIVQGVKKMRSLADIEPSSGITPLVSIVVPACNEQDTIGPAMHSLLNLEYDNYEIIAVNDRSTDHTADVLRKIQRKNDKLRVVDVTDLPEGWLGKNNALRQGVRHSRGEYLLFTDADILFEKSTISRAISVMGVENLDHLSLIFKNIAGSSLLKAMIVDAGGGLFMLFRPWKVRDRKSKNFMGVGAFNLLKRSVYDAIGGHGPVRMHPIDDIMIGKVIKEKGFRQECMTAYDFLTVRWYDTPNHMINGLMKNIFALYNFRVSYALLAVSVIFVLTILPQWALFFTNDVARIIFLFSVLLRLVSSAFGARTTGTTYKIVPFSLLTPYINVFIIVKGVVVTIYGKGIEWRGTHYPLDKLRGNLPIM